MAGKKNNLSEINTNDFSHADTARIGIVSSEWNEEITSALLKGAVNTIKSLGVAENNIIIHYVPGSFELPMGAKFLAENLALDAVICLGCVIQGETRHFEFISNAVANGITKVGLNANIPVIFGVLTTDTFQQAKDRAGGKQGNKGDEAGATAIKMIELKRKLLTK